MMARQFDQEPERPVLQTQQNVLDELERRKEAIAAETAAEQQRLAEIDAARSAVAADETVLQDRIDQLLSSSPEDFVIRFLQTEGQ